MRNTLLTGLFGGLIVLAGPVFAQSGATPADNMPLGAPVVVTDRVIDEDGTVIESRRYVDNNGNTVVTRRTIERDSPPVVERYRYYGPRHDHGSAVNGSVGGAIGGEGIIGTTSADNAPLPYEWRYR